MSVQTAWTIRLFNLIIPIENYSESIFNRLKCLTESNRCQKNYTVSISLIKFINSKTGYHVTGGPLTVETPRFLTPLGHAWPLAGRKLGYQTIDLNGPMQTGECVGTFGGLVGRSFAQQPLRTLQT